MPKSMKLPHKKKSSRYQSLSRYNKGGLASFKTNMGVDPRAKQQQPLPQQQPPQQPQQQPSPQKTVVATEDKFNRYKTRIT